MQIMLEDIKKMIQEELQHVNEFDHDGEKVVQLLKETKTSLNLPDVSKMTLKERVVFVNKFLSTLVEHFELDNKGVRDVIYEFHTVSSGDKR